MIMTAIGVFIAPIFPFGFIGMMYSMIKMYKCYPYISMFAYMYGGLVALYFFGL